MAVKKISRGEYVPCGNCKHIIDDDYTVLMPEFSIKGKNYKLVGTQVGGRSILEAVDTWKETDKNGDVRFFDIVRKKMYYKTRRETVIFD
jgi:transcription initiation factor TFIIIB Brf1 subunit/transcription initiation factor TFIIB